MVNGERTISKIDSILLNGSHIQIVNLNLIIIFEKINL